MQWKTGSVSASKSLQVRSASAIPLEEGNEKDDGVDYGGQELVRVREGGMYAETAETIWHGAPMLVQQRVEPMAGKWCVEL